MKTQMVKNKELFDTRAEAQRRAEDLEREVRAAHAAREAAEEHARVAEGWAREARHFTYRKKRSCACITIRCHCTFVRGR